MNKTIKMTNKIIKIYPKQTSQTQSIKLKPIKQSKKSPSKNRTYPLIFLAHPLYKLLISCNKLCYLYFLSFKNIFDLLLLSFHQILNQTINL